MNVRHAVSGPVQRVLGAQKETMPLKWLLAVVRALRRLPRQVVEDTNVAAQRLSVSVQPLEARIMLSAAEPWSELTADGTDGADAEQREQAIQLLNASPALFIGNQG